MSQVAGWRWRSFSWEAILTAGLALLLNIPLNWWHRKAVHVMNDLGPQLPRGRSKVLIFMQLQDMCTYIVPLCTRSYYFDSISVQLPQNDSTCVWCQATPSRSLCWTKSLRSSLWRFGGGPCGHDRQVNIAETWAAFIIAATNGEFSCHVSLPECTIHLRIYIYIYVYI